jgi:hypothetical protein
MLRFRSDRTRWRFLTLAILVVFALVGLLAWAWGHSLAGMQSRRARIGEIDVRIKALRKEANLSTDLSQRQTVLIREHRLSAERRQLIKELRPFYQRFLDLFR